jgi:acylpyruvate hydrolase
MRLATVRRENATRAARIEDDHAVLLDYPDVAALLAAGTDGATTGARVPLDGVSFAPVVPRPSKVFCVGLNYRTHIEESGAQVPTYPTLFSKVGRSLVGATDDIRLPPGPERLVDWEAELVLVIGRPVRRASADEARAAIAGFTVGNDVSVRDYQFRTAQWLQGKCFEGMTPVGPWLSTADEVGVEPDLPIRCEVDGVVKQDSRTGDLLFGPVDLVAYLSEIVTLDPGDLIFTGTPGGVGQSRTPPEYLAAGQRLRTTIDGIGILTNRCVLDDD